MRPPHPYRALGRWMFWHYRDMARERGIPYTRVRMRKASIPEPFRDLILSPDPMPEEAQAESSTPPGWFVRVCNFFRSRKDAPCDTSTPSS